MDTQSNPNNRGYEERSVNGSIPRFASYKELKPLMTDQKRVYAASTKEIALAELNNFDGK